MNESKILTALPVYNEVRHLKPVLAEVRKYCDRILVVDDGSNDGTSELLNWVSASGCLFQTPLSGKLIDYVPCYRSEAGTGTAQGFIAWQ